MSKENDNRRPLLITGGAGFCGSNLIEGLHSRHPNVQIYSLDNYFTGKKENHIEAPNIDYITGDTRDIIGIWQEEGFPCPETVFHLGEYARIDKSFDDFDTIWDFNLNGTKEVIKFCGDNEAKLIYSGSSSKFGREGEDENLSPYAWIKAKNTELIRNYSNWVRYKGIQLDYIITYFYNVYGPRHIREGEYATVIGIFERQYEAGEPLTVDLPGTQTRDFTHIHDIVEGIIICAEKGSLGEEYHLGAGMEKSILDVVKMFAGEDGEEEGKIVWRPEKRGDRKGGKADPSKARALGWKPKRTLEEYVADFVKKVEKSRIFEDSLAR